MTGTLKHATASVFLFHRTGAVWRLGLIRHPRLHRWMLPGGHQENNENPQQTALREVTEEAGRACHLINAHVGTLTDDLTASRHGMLMPLWITEQQVPPEARHPRPHVHVDHLYVAVTAEEDATTAAELAFHWFTADDLERLDMFDDTREAALMVFEYIDSLVHHDAAQPEAGVRADAEA